MVEIEINPYILALPPEVHLQRTVDKDHDLPLVVMVMVI